MANTTDIYTEIQDLWDEFHDNHNKVGNKAAARRARKAIGSIKKLATPYKKASTEENR